MAKSKSVQLWLPFGDVLSSQHGGIAKTKFYCRFYKQRPQDLTKLMLCSGCGICPPCGDFERCSINKPKPPQATKTITNYYLPTLKK